MSIALFNASRIFDIPAQTWLWPSMTVFRPSLPPISIAYVCRLSIGMRPRKSGDVLPYTLRAYGPILKIRGSSVVKSGSQWKNFYSGVARF